MDDLLLKRLETAVEKLLERNSQLEVDCAALMQEKAVWQQEREQVLGEVERILARIDPQQLEDS